MNQQTSPLRNKKSLSWAVSKCQRTQGDFPLAEANEILKLLERQPAVVTTTTHLGPAGTAAIFVGFRTEQHRAEFMNAGHSIPQKGTFHFEIVSDPESWIDLFEAKIMFLRHGISDNELARTIETSMPNSTFELRRLGNRSMAKVIFEDTQTCKEFLNLGFIRTGFTIAGIVPSSSPNFLRNDRHALIVHPFPRDIVEYQIDNDLRRLSQVPIYWERGTCSGKPVDALFLYFLQETTNFIPPKFTRRDGTELDWYQSPIDMCYSCNYPLFKNHVCQYESSAVRQYRGPSGPIIQRQQNDKMNEQIQLGQDEFGNPMYVYQLQVEASSPPGLLQRYEKTQPGQHLALKAGEFEMKLKRDFDERLEALSNSFEARLSARELALENRLDGKLSQLVHTIETNTAALIRANNTQLGNIFAPLIEQLKPTIETNLLQDTDMKDDSDEDFHGAEELEEEQEQSPAKKPKASPRNKIGKRAKQEAKDKSVMRNLLNSFLGQ